MRPWDAANHRFEDFNLTLGRLPQNVECRNQQLGIGFIRKSKLRNRLIQLILTKKKIGEPPMNGQPAGSMRINAMVCVGAGLRPAPEFLRRRPSSGSAAVLARVLPDDGFHLVLERELPFLQGDLFELFCC